MKNLKLLFLIGLFLLIPAAWSEVSIDSYLYSENNLFSSCDYYSFSSTEAATAYNLPISSIKLEKGSVLKDSSYVLDSSSKETKDKITKGVLKQCFSFARDAGPKGYSISFDYVPTWYGKEYTQYRWINNTYAIRKEINFSVNAFENVVYYNVSYSAAMNADFSDIRFSDENNSKELSYFLVDKKNSVWAYFAVNVTGLKMYMYYGNPAVNVSVSNCTKVFLICDYSTMASIPETLATTTSGGAVFQTGSNITNVSSKRSDSNTAILRQISKLTGQYRVRFRWTLVEANNFVHLNIMDASYAGGSNNDYDAHTIVSMGQNDAGKIDFFYWTTANALKDWDAVNNVWATPINANVYPGTLGTTYIFEIIKDSTNYRFIIKNSAETILEDANISIASVRTLSGDFYVAIGDLANDARWATISVGNLTGEKYLAETLTESGNVSISGFSVSIDSLNDSSTFGSAITLNYSVSGNRANYSCNMSVNSSLYSSNNNVLNNSLSGIQLNKSAGSGSYFYNFSCQNDDIFNVSSNYVVSFLPTTTTTSTSTTTTTTTTTTTAAGTTTTVGPTTTTTNITPASANSTLYIYAVLFPCLALAFSICAFVFVKQPAPSIIASFLWFVSSMLTGNIRFPGNYTVSMDVQRIDPGNPELGSVFLVCGIIMGVYAMVIIFDSFSIISRIRSFGGKKR